MPDPVSVIWDTMLNLTSPPSTPTSNQPPSCIPSPKSLSSVSCSRSAKPWWMSPVFAPWVAGLALLPQYPPPGLPSAARVVFWKLKTFPLLLCWEQRKRAWPSSFQILPVLPIPSSLRPVASNSSAQLFKYPSAGARKTQFQSRPYHFLVVCCGCSLTFNLSMIQFPPPSRSIKTKFIVLLREWNKIIYTEGLTQ